LLLLLAVYTAKSISGVEGIVGIKANIDTRGASLPSGDDRQHRSRCQASRGFWHCGR
jgi:hypothetical protein